MGNNFENHPICNETCSHWTEHSALGLMHCCKLDSRYINTNIYSYSIYKYKQPVYSADTVLPKSPVFYKYTSSETSCWITTLGLCPLAPADLIACYQFMSNTWFLKPTNTEVSSVFTWTSGFSFGWGLWNYLSIISKQRSCCSLNGILIRILMILFWRK